MYLSRPAKIEDLPSIYQLQNIPFREMAYANTIAKLEDFIEHESEAMKTRSEIYYIFEVQGKPAGFIQYIKNENDWATIIWGKWLNTLIYLAFKIAYDDLGCPKLTFAIKETNKRIRKACEKFSLRRTGAELTFFRGGGKGYITSANLIYYELTREEFDERRELLRSQSLDVTIMPPDPVPVTPSE